MAVVLNAGGRCNCCQLAGTQHAERSARIVNQIKGLSSLAEKGVPVARLGGNSTKLETPPGSRTQLIQKANQMSRANKRS